MIYTVTQVAEMLGCTEEVVAERLNQGDLPGVKYGRSWVIPADALRDRLNEKALAEAKERREPRRVTSKRREPPRIDLGRYAGTYGGYVTPDAQQDPRP